VNHADKLSTCPTVPLLGNLQCIAHLHFSPSDGNNTSGTNPHITTIPHSRVV
jgi:hypothetical protein